MDKVGSILTSVSALLVAVGTLVVLLRAGGLIGALSVSLGGEPGDESETSGKSESGEKPKE